MNSVKIEISPRSVIEAMTDDELAVFISTVLSHFQMRAGRTIGYTNPAVAEYAKTQLAVMNSVDAVRKELNAKVVRA